MAPCEHRDHDLTIHNDVIRCVCGARGPQILDDLRAALAERTRLYKLASTEASGALTDRQAWESRYDTLRAKVERAVSTLNAAYAVAFLTAPPEPSPLPGRVQALDAWAREAWPDGRPGPIGDEPSAEAKPTECPRCGKMVDKCDCEDPRVVGYEPIAEARCTWLQRARRLRVAERKGDPDRLRRHRGAVRRAYRRDACGGVSARTLLGLGRHRRAGDGREDVSRRPISYDWESSRAELVERIEATAAKLSAESARRESAERALRLIHDQPPATSVSHEAVLWRGARELARDHFDRHPDAKETT